MADDLTPEERLLRAIFGSDHEEQPPSSSDDNWWCRTCVLWHPKDMGASPAEAHAEWERRVADRANRPERTQP